MSNYKLPLYEIRGDTPFELGYNYGTTLKDRIIASTNVYYGGLIALGGTQVWVQQQCRLYAALMAKQCPHLCEEIRGMSSGCGVPEWKLYLINARTEILNLLLAHSENISADTVNECSAIMNVRDCMTAQNWDWIEPMHEHSVLLRVRKPTQTLLMLIEPGMVGKIGLNNHGIACTLMKLSPPSTPVHAHSSTQPGLPIHVILRLFLECSSLRDIDALLKRITVNTYSCIGVSDDKCDGYFMEFCGLNTFDKLYASKQQFSFHTNHYLGCGLAYVGRDLAANCSLPRYEQLIALYEAARKNGKTSEDSIDLIRELLCNAENVDAPICRAWKYRESFKMKVGTVCTLIMNTKARSMYVSRGHPAKYPFETVRVEHIRKQSKL